MPDSPVRSTPYWLAAIALIGVTAAVTFGILPSLPARIITHWTLRGAPDHEGSKTVLLLLPAGMLLLLGVFRLLPWLSPKNFEVDTFRSTYLYIMLLVVGLMAYLQSTILWAATHPPALPVRALVSGIFGFGALLGHVISKVRRNFWIGIRTPWTLADERVWDATHRLAGRWMMAGGVLALALALAGWLGVAIAVFLGSLAVPTIYSLVYSKRLAP